MWEIIYLKLDDQTLVDPDQAHCVASVFPWGGNMYRMHHHHIPGHGQ